MNVKLLLAGLTSFIIVDLQLTLGLRRNAYKSDLVGGNRSQNSNATLCQPNVVSCHGESRPSSKAPWHEVSNGERPNKRLRNSSRKRLQYPLRRWRKKHSFDAERENDDFLLPSKKVGSRFLDRDWSDDATYKNKKNLKKRLKLPNKVTENNSEYSTFGANTEDRLRSRALYRRQQIPDVTRNRSNIVLVMTDDLDMELGSLNYMPRLLNLMRGSGAMFSNAYTSTPMCCPSRSSMLTGMYIHNHQVFTNHQNCSSQDWQNTHERRSFASYLNDAGYRTGYFGKYLNRYNGSHIPVGWQDWSALLMNSRYYNYTVKRNNRLVQYGNRYPQDYYPHVITKEGLNFLKNSLARPDQPFLLVLSYPSPHGPEDSAPEHAHKYFNATDHHTAAYNYAPNPDKQWVLQFTDRMSDVQMKFTDLLMTKRLQTLQTVDEAVKKIISAIEEGGGSKNTYLFFTSDHGYHLGQYGLTKGKSMPFEFDVKVPFLVKGPGVQAGIQLSHIALNIDLAPTFLDIAGIPTPPHMDGRSLLPILNASGSPEEVKAIPWRNSFLVESSGRLREEELLEKQEQRLWERERMFAMTLQKAESKSTEEGSSISLYTSKHERLEEVCERGEFGYPCAHSQKWHCIQVDGRWKIKKCRSKKSSVWQKHCICRYDDGYGLYGKIDSRERRKQKKFLKKYMSKDFRLYPSNFLRSFHNVESNFLPKSSENDRLRNRVGRRRFARSIPEDVAPDVLPKDSLDISKWGNKSYSKELPKESAPIPGHKEGSIVMLDPSVHEFVEEAELTDLQDQITIITDELESLEDIRTDSDVLDAFTTQRSFSMECERDFAKCQDVMHKNLTAVEKTKVATEDQMRRLRKQLSVMKAILQHFQNAVTMKNALEIPFVSNMSKNPDMVGLAGSHNKENIRKSKEEKEVPYRGEDSDKFSNGSEEHWKHNGVYPVYVSELLDQDSDIGIEAAHKMCWCNRKIMKKIEIKEAREKRRQERIEIKRKNAKKRQRKKKEVACNYPKLNCYTHTNDHWKTPPLWTDGNFCFCMNSANNTYWCLRTINNTHNFLYCEFITGLITYYDLHIDPYQLRNVAFTLSNGQVVLLHEALTRLRDCRGTDECDGRVSRQRKRMKDLKDSYSLTKFVTFNLKSGEKRRVRKKHSNRRKRQRMIKRKRQNRELDGFMSNFGLNSRLPRNYKEEKRRKKKERKRKNNVEEG